MRFGLSKEEWQELPRKPFTFSLGGKEFTISVDGNHETRSSDPFPPSERPRIPTGRVTAKAIEKRREEKRARIDQLLQSHDSVTLQQAARAAHTNNPGASAILKRGERLGQYKRNDDKTWSLQKQSNAAA